MVKKSVRPTVKLTGAPFEAKGAQRLNRHKRRVAAGRFRRASASGDPLTVFLRTKQGLLWLVGGGLLFAAALYGMLLARM
jgi:hypothetical protein